MASQAEYLRRPQEERYKTTTARRSARRIEEVFSSLESLPFLRQNDKKEFRYFRRLFLSACDGIDGRIEQGELKPWSKRAIETLQEAVAADFPRTEVSESAEVTPRCLAIPPGPIRVGVFIGSFDPFQMTHLETALRFLARGKRRADLVLVIPEGAYSKFKPGRSEYGYRYDILRRQLSDVFRPFIVPLDIGEDQDTIGIVRRLITLFAGRTMELTHVLGSDVFPFAAEWYPADLREWNDEAAKKDVRFDFGAFIVKRDKADNVIAIARMTRHAGIPVQIDPKPIGTPSSTELREHGVFTIVFPTQEVLEKLEVVFRYGMHRHWLTERGGSEYDI